MKGNSIRRGCVITYLKACKMTSKGYLYHFGRVKNLDSENPLIGLVPVAKEFLEVFHNDLPKIPPEREIDFSIECLQDTNLI